MTNEAGQHRGRISKTLQRGANVALIFALALGLEVTAIQAAQAQTYKVLHAFKGQTHGFDGSFPYLEGLILDTAGNLYGTTRTGGHFGNGTVFKLNIKKGKETVLYSFCGRAGCPDGAEPYAGVVLDGAGNLYGTALLGGDNACGCPVGSSGCGTVFKLTARGRFSVLHTFSGTPDAACSIAGLTLDRRGDLYGTSTKGGTGDVGTVFKISESGQESVLHSFTGTPSDGGFPYAALISNPTGTLFGTTEGGGVKGAGSVFEMDRSGKESVLHSFSGPDGSDVWSGLVRDSSGNLYGTTQQGGSFSAGAVFKLDTTGTETVLYSFSGGSDGGYPDDQVVFDTSGNLYGTTLYGGTGQCSNNGFKGCGTVFKLTPGSGAWTETVLHSFKGGTDGQWPYAGLVRDAAGGLYGTTSEGGFVSGECSGGCGTVFKATP